MEIIQCPHCDGAVNATFELCPKCGKGLRKDWSAEIEAARAKASKTTSASGHNVAFIVGAALVVICVIAGISSALGSGQKEVDAYYASASAQASANELKFSGYCSGLTLVVDETTNTLAGLGNTSTIADATSVLAKNADLFAGYVALIKDPDQASVVQDAGKEMLQLRVALTQGGETKETAMWLKSNFTTITSVCSN